MFKALYQTIKWPKYISIESPTRIWRLLQHRCQACYRNSLVLYTFVWPSSSAQFLNTTIFVSFLLYKKKNKAIKLYRVQLVQNGAVHGGVKVLHTRSEQSGWASITHRNSIFLQCAPRYNSGAVSVHDCIHRAFARSYPILQIGFSSQISNLEILPLPPTLTQFFFFWDKGRGWIGIREVII